jgi:hypothetical protein
MIDQFVTRPFAAARRVCPAVLAALASLFVAYGFEVHPVLQLGASLPPLTDMAPGLAQAFTQLGNLPLPSLTRHNPAPTALG